MKLYEKYLKEKGYTLDSVMDLEPKQIQDLMVGFTDKIGEQNATQLKDLQQSLKDQGVAFAGLKKELTAKEQESYAAQLSKFFKENEEEIKSNFKSQKGFNEIELKAPAAMTTGSVTNVGTVPVLYGDSTGFNFKENFVSAIISNSKTSKESHKYTELFPKDGDFTFVAEGESKPQIDFLAQTRFAYPAKAAAWIKLTEEALDDVPRMESLAKEFLAKKHDLFKQRMIISSDGTGAGENIKGMTTYGRLFTAGSIALAVDNPSFMDVIGAVLTDISSTHNYQDEMNYDANIVLMNNIDYFLHVQAAKVKADSKEPLYALNEKVIGGVRIIPTNEIPVGKILVCDAKTYNQIAYKPYTVRVGWVNDDFIKNQFVIIGESRFYGFVKNLDENAYVYDDIATIKAAITKV